MNLNHLLPSLEDLNFTTAFFYFVILYAVYYLIFNVKKPVVSCCEPMKQFLEAHCPIVSEYYWPAIWCLEPRVQTVFSSLLGSRRQVSFQREELHLTDGGVILLDWVLNSDSHIPIEHRPTVIILPGLVGSSQESYVQHLAHQSTVLGFRTVVFNYRGRGGAELKTSRTYCAANSDDMAAVVEHVSNRFKHTQMFAIGVSLGGIILTNYLAQKGKSCKLAAAMSVSAAWNLFESAKSLEQPVNKLIFNKTLTQHLKQSIMQHEHMFRDKCDLEKVYKSNTIREFDESFTAPLFGYGNCVNYYNAARIDSKVMDIKVPLLCLNAADDPFSPGEFIPVLDASKSEHVAIMVTPRGGHIAFLDSVLGMGRAWYLERVFAQFFTAVFQHHHELPCCVMKE